MRVKQIGSYLPNPRNLRLVYTRITSSRLTTFFFAVALLHFALQVAFQAWAFAINASAGAFLSSIVTAGGFPPHDNFAILAPVSSDGKSGGELRICSEEDIIGHRNIYQCPVAWKGRIVENSTLGYENFATPSPTPSRSSNVTPSSSSSSTQTPITSPRPATLIVTPIPTRTSLAPTVTSVTVRRPVATAVDDKVEDDNDEEDDGDDDQEEDRKAKVKRHHTRLRGIPRLTTWRRRSLSVVSVLQKDPNGVVGVPQGTSNVSIVGVMLPQMTNATTGERGVFLSQQCVQMVLWPNQMVHNTKREDVAFLAFQFWVLGMSFVAILNESIPHIIAALLVHVLATIWSAFQLVNTANFKEEFFRSTILSGRCGVNLLPGYWDERRGAELAVLIVNCVSLVATAILSWRLIKMFGWQTFKRIGASITVNRVYKLVLVFSIGLQLAFFFVIALVGLWLDTLFNTVLGRTIDNGPLYELISILACIVMVPWLYLGWFSVRLEASRLMSIFLFLSLLLLGGWGTLFACKTFRWVFLEWRFFAVMAGAASFLLICTTILGVICFYHFNRGLKTFLLEGQQEQLARDEFERVYSREVKEKDADIVSFPSSGPIPTYAVAFGKNDNAENAYGAGKLNPQNSLSAYSYSSAGDLGSPLHDREFLESTNLPPRFQMQMQYEVSDGNPFNPYASFAQTAPPPPFPTQPAVQWGLPARGAQGLKATTMAGQGVVRNITASSTDSSEGNPFHLDGEKGDKRASVLSGQSERTLTSISAPKKTYVSPGSHHANVMHKQTHTRDGSQASWNAKKGWVIE